VLAAVGQFLRDSRSAAQRSLSVDGGIARESRGCPDTGPREGLPPQIRRERSHLGPLVPNERDALQLVAEHKDRSGGTRSRIPKPKGFLPRPAPDDAHDTAGAALAAPGRTHEVAAAASSTNRARSPVYTGRHESLTSRHGSKTGQSGCAAGLTSSITSRQGSKRVGTAAKGLGMARMRRNAPQNEISRVPFQSRSMS